MDPWEQEALRSANLGMRKQIDQVLDALADQQTRLTAIQEELETKRVAASSVDGLVEMTVDIAGVVTDVRFSADARRVTLDQLSRSVTEAGREAASRAQLYTREMLASIADAFPDMPDLVAGAPSLRARCETRSDGR
ncbi:YbaB/EbfC family nucleoid-associated protein [Nocardia pneumoniae]|uniref:YbaB/EbfC family nucleoid-associated protein n=1 Tax=Nocardia pneumoniae TaxID=228601 RepID=UPI0002DEB2D2|nr:YbaB/EbfC family nucleoid-associated protein [Nocardia pneumoniae]